MTPQLHRAVLSFTIPSYVSVPARWIEGMDGLTECNIRRVLVANRGEIALRIMRACREMGIASVAVYGDGEEHAPHVRYADDAWRIPEGPGLPYLRIEGLIDVARRAKAAFSARNP
jgi:pyruvate carboxylase